MKAAGIMVKRNTLIMTDCLLSKKCTVLRLYKTTKNIYVLGFFFQFPLSSSVRRPNLFAVDGCAPLCSLVLTKNFLSRQAVGSLSPRWFSRRWGNRLLVVLFAVKIHVCRFSCHKEDTVVNVSQHRAVVFCVGGLHWLFLHLSGETWILL